MADAEGHDFSQISRNIRRSMQQNLQIFDSIRGKEVNIPFWDIVVITALDEGQKNAYDLQLQSKLARGELPLGVKYHVFYDPPGPKIGNGGSVLVTIGDLLKIYEEEELMNSKIIMLPAGGYSQRLPNASVLGKAFTALPIGDPPYQMLELQLAMFIEFPRHMNPGIFVAASDILVVFNSEGDWSFTKPGFTALAHPSPIHIGTTHGVFVLNDHEKLASVQAGCPITQTTCKKFLHKPSMDIMRKHGIVFLCDEQEYVYTDSVFFVDWRTAKNLYDFSQQIQPIDCEIDAYGDFLQALGPEASADYTKNVANVTKETSSLISKRKKIFEFLKGTQLNVLLLNESKFYHLGTTMECIHHFCDDKVFRYESHFLSEVMVKRSGPSEEKITTDQRCLIHCYQTLPSSVGQRTLLEYCNIQAEASVGNNCIVSNVELPSGASIPDNTFMMTVCVTVDNVSGLYVTVVFGIEDNVKKMAPSDDLAKLQYFGLPLDKAMSLLDLVQNSKLEYVSLWHMELFPVFKSCTESVWYAMKMLNALKNGTKIDKGNMPVGKYLSMKEILDLKDTEGTLHIREMLRKKILGT
nr:fucose-1-phosphate guanylyltransferase-like [Pocillopora verrucosa]